MLSRIYYGVTQTDGEDDMRFSLNIQGNNGNNGNGTAANGNRSEMNEEIKMKNANTNIQMNLGNSGILAVKNTMILLGGLALAGMVAMAATFGSASADSPLKSSTFVATAPTRWTRRT